MDDDEILKTVHSILGTSAQVVDCEKTSSVRQEEILLINGIPVTLEGHDGDAIKTALRTGQVPSVELLNQLLHQAGILMKPVQLETSVSVKSSMVTTEEVSVVRGGRILDGHSTETKENYVYSSSRNEIWEPVIAKSKTPEREKMAYTPKYRLANQAATSQSSDDAVGGLEKETIPSSSSKNITATATRSTTTDTTTDVTNQMLSGDSADNNDYFYNYAENECKVVEEDDDDDEDGDEDGELYLLNPQPPAATPFQPFRNATTTIINSHDILKKHPKDDTESSKSSVASFSEKKSSLLSYDSGHDGVFHSPSQQTATSNVALPPLQQSTTNNTDHSISSCYDFISSDEADFLTATTNNSNSNFGKHCKTTFATTERSYADIQHRDLPQISKSSYNQNLKIPDLGKKSSLPLGTSAPTIPSSTFQQAAAVDNKAASAKTNFVDSVLDPPVAKTNLVDAVLDPPGSTITTTTSTISTAPLENGLVFRDGNLISGPLDALITHMVPSSEYYPSRSFIFSFLLSARLFIRPHELLASIAETWENQHQLQSGNDVVDEKCKQVQNICCGGQTQQINPPQFADEQSHRIAIKSAQNCIKLLAEWIDTFPYDFRDERLMQHVRVLARKCVYIDNNLGKTVSSILQNLMQRLTVLEKHEEFLQTLAAQENHESGTTAEDSHHKPFASSASTGCYTNSGYVHAVGSTSSTDRDDMNTIHPVELSNSAAAIGAPQKSLSSSYANASGSYHQHRTLFHHHNSHQSDSSSNSVNTFGSGGGGAIGIGDFTSSLGVSNGSELRGIYDLCPNAALLAHQLTHIELERLSHIGPEEFVQAFAKENHLESFSDMKKTRNLESYVQWFNRLSYFTATEIVKSPKKKQRVRIIEFWIETARECFNIGNFNSLMAIMLGLNLSPISRLKKTWSKIQSAKFAVLEHQMDPTSNFNSYRLTLKAAMWRSEGATNERERIIIPFFSLLVKDLYFLNEGCSNKLPNGHINFEKCWQLAKQVMEFNTWKKVTCPFEKLPKVIMFLQLSTVLNENTLAMASFECEPPENNHEKERYKTLKSETKQHAF